MVSLLIYLPNKVGVTGFAVIGYGKPGGFELDYNSDLDLVFLFDCPLGIVTDGQHLIEGRQLYLILCVSRLLIWEKIYQYQVHRWRAYFDSKTDPGDITGIEFIAQYLVLRYCSDNIALLRWSDNVRIFTLLAEYALMSTEEAQQLIQIYTEMRDTLHHLSLQALPSKVLVSRFEQQRKNVPLSWQEWFYIG